MLFVVGAGCKQKQKECSPMNLLICSRNKPDLIPLKLVFVCVSEKSKVKRKGGVSRGGATQRH